MTPSEPAHASGRRGQDSALAGAPVADRWASLARSGGSYLRWVQAGAVDAALAKSLLAEDAAALGLIASPESVLWWLGAPPEPQSINLFLSA